MKHKIELPGLREDIPRDFLAALGLLRLIDHIWQSSGAKIFWNRQNGTPVVALEEQLPENFPQDIWNSLVEIKLRDHSPFEPVSVEGVLAEAFRHKLKAPSDKDSEIVVRILAGMASQIDVEKKSRRSDFLIESGQRRVVKGVYDMLSDLSYGPALLAEVQGLAQPVKVANSSRWNPAEFRSAAYTTTDPANTDFLDYPGLNVLAFIGLTFYPVVDIQGDKATLGFSSSHGRSGSHFSWPVWGGPLAVEELSAVLHHKEIHKERPDPQILHAIGILRVWRSRKFGDTNNKYFANALPA